MALVAVVVALLLQLAAAEGESPEAGWIGHQWSADLNSLTNASGCEQLGLRPLHQAQIQRVRAILGRHHSRDPSTLKAMAPKHQWNSGPWWCHCGRQNPKSNQCCGSCGYGGVQPTQQPNRDWWNASQPPKSPKTPRGQPPRGPKPRTPKQPKQPAVRPPAVPAPPPQLAFPPGQWHVPAQAAVPSYQGAPEVPPWPAWPLPTPLPTAAPASSAAMPAVPPPAPAAAGDQTLKNLVSSLKKCSESLPPEIRELLSEATMQSDRMEAKALHGAVSKLANAKKQLTALRSTRWQMHGAWTAFVSQASDSWQGYIKDFGEQDQSLQNQIVAAKEQLAAARAHLQQSKETAASAEDVEELSDDDAMRDEVGREIAGNLETMATSLKQLRAQSEKVMADEVQQPSKHRKLGVPQADPTGGGNSDFVSPWRARDLALTLQFECGFSSAETPLEYADLRPRRHLRGALRPVRFADWVSVAFAESDDCSLHQCLVSHASLAANQLKPWALHVLPSLSDRLGLSMLSDDGMRLSPSSTDLEFDSSVDFLSLMQSHVGVADVEAVAVMLYHLREAPTRHLLSWQVPSSRMPAVIQALGLESDDVVALHPLALPLFGEGGMSVHAIVQRSGDVPPLSDDAMIVIEVMSHMSTASASIAQLPFATSRIVHVVSRWISRDDVLQRAGVSVFCAGHPDPCLVLHNGVLWDESVNERAVRHGDVFQVHLPPPNDDHPFLPDAISECSIPTPDDHLSFEDSESSVATDNGTVGDAEVTGATLLFRARPQSPTVQYFVWYIHHTRWPSCDAPRLARVNHNPDLLHQLSLPWHDRFVFGAPARISFVHPQPGDPVPSVHGTPLHVILEQGLQGTRSVALVEVDRHLAHTSDNVLAAWSLPAYITGDLLVRTVQVSIRDWLILRCVIQHGPRRLQQVVLETCPSGAFFQIRPTVPPPTDVTSLWQLSVTVPIKTFRVPDSPRLVDLLDSELEPDDAVAIVVRPGLDEQTPFIQALHAAWTQYQAAEHQEEGPVAYFRTFYLSSLRQAQCVDGRAARLCADFHEWVFALTSVWRDFYLPHEPLRLFLVSPEPPRDAASAGVAGFILLVQEPDADYVASLVTVTHSEELVTQIATFAPPLIQRRQVLTLAGVPLRVCSGHPLLQCTVSAADRTLDDDRFDVPIMNGCSLVVRMTPISSIPPPWEASTTELFPSASTDDHFDEHALLQRNSFGSVRAPVSSLAMKSGLAVTAPSGSAASSTACSSQPSISVHQSSSTAQLVNPIRVDAFLKDLHAARLDLALDSPVAPDEPFSVLSFFLSGWYTSCHAPRQVQLHGPASQWMAQLHMAWRDLVSPDFQLRFQVVHPKPLTSHSDASIVAHVLVYQNIADTDSAVHVTTIERGQLSYCGLVVPSWVNRLVLLARTGNLPRCQDPLQRLRCFTWFSGMVIRDAPFFQAHSGFGFLLGIFESSSPSTSLLALDAHELVQLPPEQTNHVHRRDVAPAALPSTSSSVQASPAEPSLPATSTTLSLEPLLGAPFSETPYLQIDVADLLFVFRQLFHWTCPLPLGFDSVVKWHDSTFQAHQSLPAWDASLWPRVQRLCFYTDGSSIFDKVAALRCGAASVVLIAYVDEVEYFVGFLPWHLVPPATAQRAEHAAILGGLLWLFTLLRDMPFLACWAWNEAADASSWAALHGWVPAYPLHEVVNLLTLDGSHPELPSWFWYLSGTLRALPSFPLLWNQTFYFNVASPFHNDPKLPLLPSSSPAPVVTAEMHEVDWLLHVAQANVLSLYPQDSSRGQFVSARHSALLRDFDQIGVDVVGVQETRSQLSGHSLIDSWHILSAPATHGGTGGVQLWIRTSFTIAGRSFDISDKHLKIVHTSSRRLIVLLRTPWLQLRFLVGHAPHDEPGADLAAWWRTTSHLLHAAHRHLPLIALLDANAKVGSLVSDSVGSFRAEEENTAGAIFHSWLIRENLFLPQTFEQFGQQAFHTFTHARGTTSRIDYVALDRALLHDGVQVAMADVDLSIQREDHHALRAAVPLRLKVQQPARPPKPVLSGWPDNPSLDTLNWSLNVHDHAVHLHRWVAQFCPPKRRARPRKTHLSVTTWDLIQTKKYHWNQLRLLTRRQRSAFLSFVFRSWASRSTTAEAAASFAQTDSSYNWQLAQHADQYRRLCLSVTRAVRADDAAHFSALAARHDDTAPQSLWFSIKPLLPKNVKRRQANLRCVGPSPAAIYHHFDALEAGQPLPYLMQEQLVMDVATTARRMTKWLDTCGLSPKLPAIDVTAHSLDFTCPQCSEAFTTPQGLQAHLWSKHRVYSVERRLCFGTVCLSCRQCYWTTQRLQQHIRQSRLRGHGCFFDLASRFAPDPCPVVHELPAHLHGIERIPAQTTFEPHVPLPPLQFFPPALHHDSWAEAWRRAGGSESVLQSTFDVLSVSLLEIFQRWLLTPDSSLSDSILDLFHSSALSAQFLESDLVWCFAIWVRRYVKGIWPSWFSVADKALLVSALGDFWAALPLCTLMDACDHLAGCLPDVPPHHHAAAAVDVRGRRAREPFDFSFLDQTATLAPLLPLPPENPLPARPVPVVLDANGGQWIYILHLFSGRRRSCDLHDWLLHLGPGYFEDKGIVVVSVDTAIHPKYGDLLNAPAGPALDELCRLPFFGAAFSGPPCETWSAARHNALELPSGKPGPRPLRATPSSWGVPFLSQRELNQLSVASRLMLKSLEWEFGVCIQGGADTMEHPEKPADDAKASVWASAFHRSFFGAWVPSHEVSIEQWRYGATAVKPTRLRITNVPAAQEGLRAYQCPHGVRPQTTLIGLDNRTGQFKTAAAKEYPSGLSLAMARTVGLLQTRTLSPRDLARAKQVVPGPEFLAAHSGDSNELLNKHLLRMSGGKAKRCEDFTHHELDAVLESIATKVHHALQSIYETNEHPEGDATWKDPRGKAGAELAELNQLDLESIPADLLDTAKLEKKCYDAAMAFTHSVTDKDKKDGQPGYRALFPDLAESACANCHSGGVEARATFQDNVDIVAEGEGSMPGFKDKLSKEEIKQVAQYVIDESEKGW
eukprot:Skav213378  [mRNA]  locus=scaffold797:151888:166430:+ [translate_table: standard]